MERWDPLHGRTRQVGRWRVKAWLGQGGNGAVFRAERVGWRGSEAGALKVSQRRWNWRMEREVELLSRLSHPSIPRLLDRGGPWRASGEEHPYFVMEYVHGVSLYAWAEQQAPSGKQVCRVLAQVARALEAVHAVGAVHRDVKGDNILVRSLDGRGMLTDFGSCHFPGAARLTWGALPPVTPEYLSPQAVRFYCRSPQHPDDYYPPSPADDLYALGVMAYRLVMGQYPARGEARQDALERNPRVEPPLREVIARLLSEAPEARGTAAGVAEALEAAAGEEERPERPLSPKRIGNWKRWVAVAAAGACAVSPWLPRQSSEPQRAQDSTVPATDESPVAQAFPAGPRPGQARPDERGRCPGPRQVAVNGGCWFEFTLVNPEDCTKSGNVLVQGKCYVPVAAPPQKAPPTSSPAEAR